MATEPTPRDMIPALLDQHRPDRYDPTDKSWMDPVVDLVAADISAVEARQVAAIQYVSSAEATATRRTNKMLRAVATTGELPLDEWPTAMAWPLAVGDNERVALRAATIEDFTAFANRERRQAATDFTSRNQACEGALALADMLTETGAGTAGHLVEAVAS